MEQRIGIERMEEAVNLFGSFDENIRLLEAEFQVQAVNRGGEIVVSGEPENVMLAVKAVHPTHLQVDGVDARVAGHQHIHLAGEVHPLLGQRCADDPAEKAACALADTGDIGGHRDIVSFHFFFSSNLA